MRKINLILLTTLFYSSCINFNDNSILDENSITKVTNKSSDLSITRIEMSKSRINLKEGKNEQIEASIFYSDGNISSAVEWESSDNTIASVSQNGTINALKAGTVLIKAYAAENHSFYAECIVYITKDKIKPISIKFIKTIEYLTINESFQFKAGIKYSDGSSSERINWDVSDNKSASINKNGVLNAINEGEITVIASSEEDESIKAIYKIFIINNNVSEKGKILTVLGNDYRDYKSNSSDFNKIRINGPWGISLDKNGNIYFSDTGNNLIRIIGKNNYVSDLAGIPDSKKTFSGDSKVSYNAHLNLPGSVTTDNENNIYLIDTSNKRIRKIDYKSKIINTIAGNGLLNNISGNRIYALETSLGLPADLHIRDNNMYITDSNVHKIKRISLKDGKIYDFAGDGYGVNGTGRDHGDGNFAIKASLMTPTGLTSDSSGNIYVSDRSAHRIRKIDTKGIITTIAGNGEAGYNGENIPAINAKINTPMYLKFDKNDNLYFSEFNGHRIRKIDTKGIITTIAGKGSPEFSGDNGPAINAGINNPAGLAFDQENNLLFSDFGNNRIRKIILN